MFNEHCALCFRDAEVKEEGFLEYINQLLMTGEVAGLLPKEELETILNDVRPVFKRECIGGHASSCVLMLILSLPSASSTMLLAACRVVRSVRACKDALCGHLQ